MLYCPACHTENAEGSSACSACGQTFVTAATPTLTQGAIIGSRYEILSSLGKGGMGMVFKAHDRVLDETVALKILRPDVAGAGEMLKRFRSEIKLARKVRHKNVCGIHEYGTDGNLQFIAMEFVQGIDLKRLLKEKGTLPPEDAFSIAIQLARGLQAIHEVGIIHRDLKTANAMIDDLGIVHLMDFGIAKKYDAEGSLGATAVGHIIGTPEYMSPEQARGEKVDFRSDIYALGVMIFEIFTGKVPFQAETPIATIFRHLQDPPPLEEATAHGMPAALIPVLAKMLAKEAGDRYPNARIVVEALRQARSATIPEAGMTPIPGETVKMPEEDVETRSMPRPLGGSATPPTLLSTPRAAPTVLATPALMPKTMRAGRSSTRSVLPWLFLPVLGLAGLAAVAVLFWISQGSDQVENELLTPTTTTTPAPFTPRTVTPAPTVETTPTSLFATPAPTRAPVRVDRPSPPPPSTLRLGPVVSPPPPPSTPKPVANGTLIIIARPWAEVTINGTKVGNTPPLKPQELPAGKYSVVLSHPSFKPVQRKVTVHPGQETRLEVDLNWEAVPR